MKVSKDSWHFKFNNFMMQGGFSYELRNNNYTLCTYFWKTVFHMFFFLMIGVASLVLGWLFIFNPVMFIITGIIGFPVSWVSSGGALAIIFLSSIIAMVCGIADTVSGKMKFMPDSWKFWRKFKKDIPEVELVNKKPSLFVEYYKAHKAKYCTIVELED